MKHPCPIVRFDPLLHTKLAIYTVYKEVILVSTFLVIEQKHLYNYLNNLILTDVKKLSLNSFKLNNVYKKIICAFLNPMHCYNMTIVKHSAISDLSENKPRKP